MINKNEIYFSWQGHQVNIIQALLDPKILANSMLNLSKMEIYSSSYSQYEQFCYDSLYNHNKDCFCAIFLYGANVMQNHMPNILGFLNVRVAFSHADIDFICVDPQYRRMHIANELFHFFEQLILKEGTISKVFLEVAVTNKPAISFYEKIGFKKISLRKKYYKKNLDAFVMEKELLKSD